MKLIGSIVIQDILQVVQEVNRSLMIHVLTSHQQWTFVFPDEIAGGGGAEHNFKTVDDFLKKLKLLKENLIK